MSRYRTQRTRGGGVVQAGLDYRTAEHRQAGQVYGIYRGVVLETFVPQHALEVDEEPVEENFRRFQVECTVLLVKTNLYLRQVPVRQPFYGVNNAQTWVPRPTTRGISGAQPLNFNRQSNRGQFIDAVISLDDIDGDLVTVEFMEGDPDFPVITGALNHERSNRLVRVGKGWVEGEGPDRRARPEQDEYFLHHQGCELRINADGELLIDTVGAYTDITSEDSSTAKGDVRVRVKDTQKLTIAMGDDEDVLEVWKDGTQLRIDLGEGATERIVLGDAFLTLYNNHTHPTGVGPSGTPVVQMQANLHLSEVAKTKQS